MLGTPDHIPEMKRTFGPVAPGAARMIAFSPEPLPVLTRSVAVLRKMVNDAFDVAEREDVPSPSTWTRCTPGGRTWNSPPPTRRW